MRLRVFLLVVACVGVVVRAALAQTTPDPAPSPSPTLRAAEESRPRSVETPTSDEEARAEGRPLTPREAELETEADTTMQPEEQAVSEEAVLAEQTLVPEESRKRWRIIPLFTAGVVYNDNIFLTNEDRVPDVIWTLSAGLAFELGDFRGKGENFLTGYWLGIPVIYTNNPEQSAFNQSAALIGQYRWNRLVARLQSNFDIATGPSREVNTIVATRTYSNALRFQYDYSEKTSFDWQFTQSHSESSDPAGPTSEIASEQTTNNRYDTKAGVNYQMFPKTSVGVEAAGGILEQSSSELQYYQQARLRLKYVATGKLNLKFTGGADVREFQGSDLIKITPVFSLGFDYRPFDGTTFVVVGYRNVSSATSITGQDITATGFEIAVSQRVFQKFIAAVSFGYENDVYSSIGNAPPTDRVDNYIYVRPSLRYSFVDWFSATVFYEFRQTDSTQTESSFYNNRVGMELALRF